VSPLASALLVLLVVAAAFVAFLPTLEAGFVNWDDDMNFTNNADFRGLGWANLRWMFTTTFMGNWIPLTWLTLGLNYALGGMNPFGYHLVNVLVHAMGAGAFFLVARRLLASAFAPSQPAVSSSGKDGDVRNLGGWPVALGATLATLVFAVHPLRVESVAWITERRDVLCTLFYMLAVLAYVRGVEGGRGLGGGWRAAALAAFAASLLSKPMAMTLPLTLVILDCYPLRRHALGWRRLAREKLPFAVLGALGAVGALVFVSLRLTWTGLETYGLPARVAMSAYSFWFYLWKFVWPAGLSPLYELPARVDPFEPRFLGPILAVLAITVALICLGRRWPAGLAAWAQSLIVLAPVSGLVHSGYQLAYDRYSDLSGLGFALLVGGGLTWVLGMQDAGRIRRPVTAAVLAGSLVLVAVLGVGAWGQSHAWHDSESLWRSAIDADPGCMICRNNLGTAVLAAGRYGEAEAAFRTAIALRPDRVAPWSNLGTALASQDRYDEAGAAFARVLDLSQGQFPDALANLGRIHVVKGRWAEAIPLLRRANAIEPGVPVVREGLRTALRKHGAALATAGRPADAEALFRQGLDLGDDPVLLLELGGVVLEQGRFHEALGFLERAGQMQPRDPQSRAWLARGYARAGDGDRARSELAALAALDPVLAARVESEIAARTR
jgi:Flp pilus assembly protein TadD